MFTPRPYAGLTLCIMGAVFTSRSKGKIPDMKERILLGVLHGGSGSRRRVTRIIPPHRLRIRARHLTFFKIVALRSLILAGYHDNNRACLLRPRYT
jgi:hypothetical protein